MNLNKGLVGYWTMDSIDGGKVRDSSANDNHGEMLDTPKVVDGLIGSQALEFDEEDSRVEAGSDIDFSQGFTFSHWIRLEKRLEEMDATNKITFANASESGTRDYNGFKNRHDDIRIATGQEDPEQVFHSVSDSDYQLNVAHQYVGVWRPSGVLELWRDGKIVGSVDTGDWTPRNWDKNYIGGHQGDNGWFEGIVGESRVYNRALSEKEIKTLYQMRNPSLQVSNAPERSDLVLYLDAGNRRSYDPDQEEYRWYDLSGNGFEAHGTTGEGSLDDSEFPEWTLEAGGSFDFAGTYGLNVPGPLPDSDELTIEVWMKRKDLTDSNNYISDARNGGGTWHLTNYRNYSNDSPVRHINISWDLEADDPPEEDEDGNASTPESNWWDRWTHIVFMSDGSESRLYVDGERINDERLKNDDPFSTGLGEDFAIGNRYTGSQSLDGEIAVFRVYNRALPDKQVKINYRAEKNRFNK